MENYYYLLLNIFTISVPLIRSFEPRVHYYKNFKGLFIGILITGAFFIIWDIIFTANGIWGFNSQYLTGIDIINLPLEEWLFFLTVPYASVFIYEVINYFLPKNSFNNYATAFAKALAFFLLGLAAIYYDQWYTFCTFLFTSLFLVFLIYIEKAKWLGNFFRSYLIVLVPFFMVNGILTGSFIEGEIVWYNDQENLGIRLFTIPIEDSFYGMLLILMNTYFLEKFRVKS